MLANSGREWNYRIGIIRPKRPFLNSGCPFYQFQLVSSNSRNKSQKCAQCAVALKHFLKCDLTKKSLKYVS